MRESARQFYGLLARIPPELLTLLAVAAAIQRVKGLPRNGVRTGNSMTDSISLFHPAQDESEYPPKL